MAISFLRANGVQAASASLLASSVKEGTLIYDDTANKLKVCDGTTWVDVGSGSGSGGGSDPIVATGGTVTTVGAYKIHTFTSSGTFTVASGSGDIEVYVAGGGGGGGGLGTYWGGGDGSGGNNVGGDGGPGGTAAELIPVSSLGSSVTVTVGVGGTGGPPGYNYPTNAIGQTGGSSSFGTFVSATGGGGAGSYGLHTPSASGSGTGGDVNGGSSVTLAVSRSTPPPTDIAGGASGVGAQTSTGGGAGGAGDAGKVVIVYPINADGGTDTLASLSCAAGEIAKYNGAAWACAADGGGSSGGNSMVTGWPDAIKCNVTNPNWGPTIFYAGLMPLSTNLYYYRNHTNGTNQDVIFTAAGVHSGYTVITATSDCGPGITIAGLYSAGKAYNFVGGASAAADGTAGQVQFNEGGNLKADADLHWDNATKRLGIGTATPGYAIEAKNGSLASTLTGTETNSSSNVALVSKGGGLGTPLQNAANLGWMLYARSDAYSTAAQQNDFGLGYWNGTAWTTALTADSLTGNVGIATASPGRALDVAGIISASGIGAAYTTAGWARPLELNHGSAIVWKKGAGNESWGIGKSNAGTSSFSIFTSTADDNSAAANTLMTVRADGNVGIGTATPQRPLHVTGSNTGNISLLALENPDTTNGSGQLISYRTSTTGTGAADFVEMGALRLVTTEHDHATRSSQFDLYTTANGSFASRLTIDENGNVGIGTSGPEGKLEIVNATGGTTSSNYLQITGSTANNTNYPGISFKGGSLVTSYPNIALNNGGYGLYLGGGTSGVVANRAGMTFDSAVGTSFTFGTSTAMQILPGGNVGIGTTVPAAKLEVIGDAPYNNGGVGIRVSTSNGSTANTIWMGASSVDDASTIQSYKIGTGLGVRNLLLNPNGGNVGIGTTTPDEKLVVSGKVKASQFCNSSGTCIDVGSVAVIPTGAVMAFDLTTCPTGWAEYTAARGRFLRGIDNSAGNDPSGTRAPGNVQPDELKSHTHTLGLNGENDPGPTLGANAPNSAWWYNSVTKTTSSTGGAETRPKNVAVLFCRKN